MKNVFATIVNAARAFGGVMVKNGPPMPAPQGPQVVSIPGGIDPARLSTRLSRDRVDTTATPVPSKVVRGRSETFPAGSFEARYGPALGLTIQGAKLRQINACPVKIADSHRAALWDFAQITVSASDTEAVKQCCADWRRLEQLFAENTYFGVLEAAKRAQSDLLAELVAGRNPTPLASSLDRESAERRGTRLRGEIRGAQSQVSKRYHDLLAPYMAKLIGAAKALTEKLDREEVARWKCLPYDRPPEVVLVYAWLALVELPAWDENYVEGFGSLTPKPFLLTHRLYPETPDEAAARQEIEKYWRDQDPKPVRDADTRRIAAIADGNEAAEKKAHRETVQALNILNQRLREDIERNTAAARAQKFALQPPIPVTVIPAPAPAPPAPEAPAQPAQA
jgi:hypothetical protein